MKKSFMAWLSLVLLIGTVEFVLATQYEGFVEFGGMELTERGICEGHKSWTSTGLDVKWGDGDLKWMFTGKFGGMFEPVDDDPELPQSFTYLFIESSYDLSINEDLTFFPLMKISYDRWLRNENSKYVDSFSELSFLSGNLGIGARYKDFYIKLGSSLPFLIMTNGNNLLGKLGLNAVVGIEWERLTLGFLYRQMYFDKVQLGQYGVRVGIKFK